jgi:hypothetical protein
MSLSPEHITKAQEYNTKVEGQRWSHADLPQPLAGLAVGSPEFAVQVAAWQVEEELFEDGKLGPRTLQALIERRIEEEVTGEQSAPLDLGFWVQGAPWPESAAIGEVSPPLVKESLDEYLDRMGIRHFSAYELTRAPRWGRNVEPLREDWPNIVPALRLAEILRHELGGEPLLVLSGYRPRRYNKTIGGAKNSQHLRFRAVYLSLDTEEARSDERKRRLYEVSARLFARYGADLKMGLGFYTRQRGDRVSIDAGFGLRSWESDHVKAVLAELALPYPA